MSEGLDRAAGTARSIARLGRDLNNTLGDLEDRLRTPPVLPTGPVKVPAGYTDPTGAEVAARVDVLSADARRQGAENLTWHLAAHTADVERRLRRMLELTRQTIKAIDDADAAAESDAAAGT